MDKYCTFCCQDISHGNQVYDGILKLSDCPLSPKGGGVVLDICIQPQLGKDHFFCGMGCLKKWLEKQE